VRKGAGEEKIPMKTKKREKGKTKKREKSEKEKKRRSERRVRRKYQCTTMLKCLQNSKFKIQNSKFK